MRAFALAAAAFSRMRIEGEESGELALAGFPRFAPCCHLLAIAPE